MKKNAPILIVSSCCIFLFLGLFCPAANGQNSCWQFHSFDNVFSHDIESSSWCQDYRGFIWIASQYGLKRLDGSNVQTFTEESHWLYNNMVRTIIATPDSMLMLAYGDPINQLYYLEVFDPLTHQVIPLQEYIKTPLPFEVDDKKLRIQQNADGSIWMFNDHFIYEYDGQKLQQRLHFAPPEKIKYTAKTAQNNIWIISPKKHKRGNGIFYINAQGQILDTNYLPSQHIYVLGIANEETLVIGNIYKNNHICTKKPFHPVEVVHPQHSFDPSTIVQTYLPNNQTILVLSEQQDNKVETFNLEGKKIQQHQLLNPKFNPKHLNFRYHPFQDKKGRIWFMEKGRAAILYAMESKFKQLLHRPKSLHSIRGITTDKKGKLYVNGSTSFSRYNSDSTFTQFLNISEPLAIFIEDSCIWFTGAKGDIIHYNPSTQKKQRYRYSKKYPHPLPAGGKLHWTIFRDQQQRLWFGHANGLSYLDTTTHALIPYNLPQKLNVVFHIYQNQDGIWLLTSSGLYLMNEDYQIVEHYHKNGARQKTLSNNVITHLHEDAKGHFWLATKGGGLIHWSKETGEIANYKIKTQISDNVIYAVYPDDFGNLWLSSNFGLVCFNKQSKEMTIYPENHGITHREFNTISHHQDSLGNLYFGGLNGITTFHPKDLITQHTQAALKLVWVKKYNRKNPQIIDATAEAVYQNSLTILPSTQKVHLKFTSLDYGAPDQVQFAYKIEGLHQEWQALMHQELYLASLPYGKHKLLIRTKKAGKKWTQQPYTLHLNVICPFYLSWWFIAFVFIACILLVVLIIKIRMRLLEQQKKRLEDLVVQKTATIQEQAEELKSLDKLKSRFFTNISHELRTPLTLILGPLSYLINKPNAIAPNELPQLKLMERTGRQLMKTIEEILDLSKLDTNKIDVENQPFLLLEFCEYMFSMFTTQMSYKQISFQLVTQFPQDLVLSFDKNKTEKILTNLLGNAMKFTPNKGYITFKIKEKKGFIEFIVEDSGPGIPTDELEQVFNRFYQSKSHWKKGTGVGLALSKEFALLMGGTLTVQSVVNQGSTFTFKLPKAIAPSTSFIPIKNKQATATPPMQPNLLYDQSEKVANILIVEDDVDMQFFVSTLLNSHYTITITNHGEEAKDYLLSTSTIPDLILSDISMPKMDGISLFSWVKSQEQFNNIPFIILSAKTEKQQISHAFTIGVDDYLPKPFSPKELLLSIQRSISNVKARTEHLEDNSNQEKEVPQNNISLKDKVWIRNIEELAKTSIIDTELDAKLLAKAANISLSSLQRRIKKITGLSVTHYLREIRLQTARELLESGNCATVAETAYSVGFSTPYYFSKLFENRFGKKVSSYFKDNSN